LLKDSDIKGDLSLNYGTLIEIFYIKELSIVCLLKKEE
jgi:hypothetical protein